MSAMMPVSRGSHPSVCWVRSLERPALAAPSAIPQFPAVVRAIRGETRPWVLDNDGERVAFDPDPVLRLSTLAIRDAVYAGAGAALFPIYFVRDDIASGRLVSWGVLEGEPLEFWVLHASARLGRSKVRAFIDVVVDTFAPASV